jgi:hypothetical protein
MEEMNEKELHASGVSASSSASSSSSSSSSSASSSSSSLKSNLLANAGGTPLAYGSSDDDGGGGGGGGGGDFGCDVDINYNSGRGCVSFCSSQTRPLFMKRVHIAKRDRKVLVWQVC